MNREKNEDDLFEDQSRALRALKEGPLPPPALEERVIAALRGRRLVRGGHGSGRFWMRLLAASAASLLLVAFGAAAGFRLASRADHPRGDRFVLFLYEGSDFRGPEPGRESERVEEYRTWARRLGQEGHLLAGEKLMDGEQVLGGPDRGPGLEAIGGYFVIAARDAGQARTIASGCPHLRYGGRIAVRQIDPV